MELQNRQLQAEIGENVRAQGDLNKLWCAIEQKFERHCITNNWGIIEYVNPKFTQLTGYRPEEVIGKIHAS